MLTLCGEFAIHRIVRDNLEQSRFEDLSSREFVFTFLSFRRLQGRAESQSQASRSEGKTTNLDLDFGSLSNVESTRPNSSTDVLPHLATLVLAHLLDWLDLDWVSFDGLEIGKFGSNFDLGGVGGSGTDSGEGRGSGPLAFYRVERSGGGRGDVGDERMGLSGKVTCTNSSASMLTTTHGDSPFPLYSIVA